MATLQRAGARALDDVRPVARGLAVPLEHACERRVRRHARVTVRPRPAWAARAAVVGRASRRAFADRAMAETLGKRQRKPTQLFGEAGELSDDDDDWERRQRRRERDRARGVGAACLLYTSPSPRD